MLHNSALLTRCAILQLRADHERERFASCPCAQAEAELLYRASRDGFRRVDFVRRCANKGSTVTLVSHSNSTASDKAEC